MTNESWQTICQIAVAIGLGLAALGGFGAYVFNQRIERAKSARGAHAGKIEPKRVMFSLADQIIPRDRIWGFWGDVSLWRTARPAIYHFRSGYPTDDCN